MQAINSEEQKVSRVGEEITGMPPISLDILVIQCSGHDVWIWEDSINTNVFKYWGVKY